MPPNRSALDERLFDYLPGMTLEIQFMRRNKWAELDDMVFKQCARHWETDLKLLHKEIKK